MAAEQVVTLPDGRIKHAVPDDWLITRGRIIIDLVGPARLAEQYQVVDGTERLLSTALCTRLEETLGLGATRTVDGLVEAIERLARISIGEIHVDFTPGQLEEIKHRATKRGQTIQQALQAVVDRIREALFWGS